MHVADIQTNGCGRIPANVTLRECSVVIIGSTCRICGRNFKCESDVALHTRWRHNAALGSLMDHILDHKMTLKNMIDQKCDVCDMSLGTMSNLIHKIHKRLIDKHRVRHRKKRRKGTIRVKFKLNGVTTTDVSLDRKYIKVQNNFRCIVNVHTQTPAALENKIPERKDECTGNIDLCFPNHITDNTADKSHIQYDIRPDKAANQYIVGKFASTKDDAITNTVMMGKNLLEISNTPHKTVILGSNSSFEEHKDRHLVSQETTDVLYIKTLNDNTGIRDKENSPRTSERERKNIRCPNEISFDDDKVLLACQPEKSNKTTSSTKENSWSSESSHHSIRRPNEVARTKETAGLTNSFINSVEIIINDEKSYNFDGNARKHLSPPLSRLNRKTESITNSNVDDDVQEVLRIIRGNTMQNDINHESPNRKEREILIQNVTSDTLPSQLKPTIYPEKCDVAFINFDSNPSYPSYPFVAVTESDYQFLANSINKNLDIYLEDLRHYGFKLYSLPEMNNNLEEYVVYAHENFFEKDKPPYTSRLKTKDNEVDIVLD